MRRRKLNTLICENCGKVFRSFRKSKYCSVICSSRGKTSTKDTICWDCKKATGFCSWSEKFIPVEGWKATPTIVKIANNYGKNKTFDDSFIVHECPLFERG